MLLEKGHSVVGLDNLNNYYDVRLKSHRLAKLLGHKAWSSADLLGRTDLRGSLISHCGRFTFFHADIEHLSVLETIFTRYKLDAVYNLAARAGVRASMENPYIFLSTNTQGVLNLLECQRRFNVTKQVLASTSSLYSGCKMPFTEDLPVNTPLSPYAAAKKAAELMAYSYHKLYDLDVTVLRYFTVYGPAGRPDMAPFRFIQWIKNGVPVNLFGDGSQARDFTFVDDIAAGTVVAVAPVGYEIVNLGGGQNPIPILNLISEIEAALGRKAKVNVNPFHKADVKATWADIAKAKRLFGWSPSVDFKEGIRRTVKWHIEAESWIDSIQL
jgi:UDP-glucuronate 4-epimerase